MADIVQVDAASLDEIERFLASELGQPVDLGGVLLGMGRFGATAARIAGASAITFGRVICLAGWAQERSGLAGYPSKVLNAGEGLERLGALLVHECTHVWQYRSQSVPRFLAKYLLSYSSSISVTGLFSAPVRRAAYHAIPFEAEAYRMEERWARRQGDDAAGTVVDTALHKSDKNL